MAVEPPAPCLPKARFIDCAEHRAEMTHALIRRADLDLAAHHSVLPAEAQLQCVGSRQRRILRFPTRSTKSRVRLFRPAPLDLLAPRSGIPIKMIWDVDQSPASLSIAPWRLHVACGHLRPNRLLTPSLVRSATEMPVTEALALERNPFLNLCISEEGLARMRSDEKKKITSPSRSFEVSRG
jgi:hypothetical protein